ncbi:hypothetical protein IG631_17661 [Alternaria alternata]|nr:hypothetical protein IG631_17661 [Alternaria alternata]
MLRRQSLSIGLAMDFPVNLTAIFQGSSYACRTKNLRKKSSGHATLSCANRCKVLYRGCFGTGRLGGRRFQSQARRTPEKTASHGMRAQRLPEHHW